MKKLLLFLQLIPALIQAQKVEYFPKRDSNWNQLREIAFAVLSPDNNYPKPWKLEIAIHGISERGPGSLSSLKSLVEGPDYNNDKIPDGPPFVTADMKKAVNQYGILLIVPTYETNEFFEPAKVNSLYDYAQANYTLYPKMFLTGFSYGGGATVKYATSSTANAARLALAIPCAPTRNVVDASVPGKAGIAMHFFVNDKDDNAPTNISVTKGMVDDINRSATLKVLYTAFRKDGHGSNIEAWSLTPPKAPGGQGFIDAAENSYQLFSDIVISGKPRQMKSGTVIPTPDPIPAPSTKAIVTFTLTGNRVKLIGSESTGYTNGLDGTWAIASAPAGLFSWDVFPGGSNYIDADGVLPKAGIYSFAFRLKGDPEVKTVTINFGKVPVSFDSSTDLLTYSDGSTEKATAIFSGGKWTVKTETGQIIQF